MVKSTNRHDDNPFKQLLFAQITGVNPDGNSITASFLDAAGVRNVQINSPFGSINSFRRSIPEVGSYVLLGFRSSNTINPIIIRYLALDELDTLIKGGMLDEDLLIESQYTKNIDENANNAEKVPFRVLRPGEHEDISSGQATGYYSDRGLLELRGKNLRVGLNPDDLEIEVATPTFRIEGLDIDPQEMEDVHRFGVVTRYKEADSRWKTPIKDGDFFAKEVYTQLAWDGTPNSLILIQSGICTDSTGEIKTDSLTGEKLRHIFELGTVTDDILSHRIDETGNYTLILPDSATTGMTLSMPGGNSSLTIAVGKDFNVEVEGDQNVKVTGKSNLETNGDKTDKAGGKLTLQAGADLFQKAGGSVTIQGSGQVTIKGAAINLQA